MVSEGIRVLTHVEDELIDLLPEKYPELMRALNLKGRPVVLEIKGISEDRIFNENGAGDVARQISLFHELKGTSGVKYPAAFRIEGLCSADIFAIHDIENLTGADWENSWWQPSEEIINANRASTTDWLKRNGLGLRPSSPRRVP
jgi:hypothetical protein